MPNRGPESSKIAKIQAQRPLNRPKMTQIQAWNARSPTEFVDGRTDGLTFLHPYSGRTWEYVKIFHHPFLLKPESVTFWSPCKFKWVKQRQNRQSQHYCSKMKFIRIIVFPILFSKSLVVGNTLIENFWRYLPWFFVKYGIETKNYEMLHLKYKILN